MNIVNAGSIFQVYGEDVQTYKHLPVDTYEINFSKNMGFFLTRCHDLEVNEKVYGTYKNKVSKVLKTFGSLDRNMGVILSGPKGVGKSMFARLLALEGYEENLPLLLVRNAIPDISSFISSIDQECIVLFDEFEKIFKTDNETGYNPQTELLSLFDGLDGGKKLFVITCNEISGLNSYLLNRPGRFHYHFMMSTPVGEEVREYMNDVLEGEARQYIDKLVALSTFSGFTYDILRAIAFELNNGYDLAETMTDLNIERERYLTLDMKVIFNSGITASVTNIDLDMFNNRCNYEWCNLDTSAMDPEIGKRFAHVQVRFYTKDIVMDEHGYHLDKDKVSLVWDDDWDYIEDKELRERIRQFFEVFKAEEIVLTRSQPLYGSREFATKFLVQ